MAPSINSNHVTSHPTSSNPLQSTFEQEDCVVQSCFSTNSKGVLLGTALVLLCHHGLTHKVRALVDSGSEASFISQKLFQTLKLPYKRTCAQISGLNNTIAASVQKECSIILSSLANHSVRIPVSALVVQHLSGNLPSRFIDPNVISNLPVKNKINQVLRAYSFAELFVSFKILEAKFILLFQSISFYKDILP